jgi:uncharacterized protein (DUF362 family)
MYKVYVEQIRNQDQQCQAIISGFLWINWEALVPEDARVFVKPNFATYPIYRPGVTTSPWIIDNLLKILRTRTRHIIIGESDGARGAWGAEEAFVGHHMLEIAERYEAKLVNLSRMPWEFTETTVCGQKVSIALPSILLHEIEVFITVPVPKIHCMTQVSLAFKNQWGCLPDIARYRNHPDFDRKIIAINKLLPTKIVLFDGKYFLDKNGPLLGGRPVEKNLVIISNDLGAASLVCCEIMGIPWQSISHFRVAHRDGLFPISMDEVLVNTNVSQFRDHIFRLHRNPINWLGLLVFRSKSLTWLRYDSPLNKYINWVLNLIRGDLVKEYQNKKKKLLAHDVSFFENTDSAK